MKKAYRLKKNETIKSVLNKRDNVKDGFFNVYKRKNNIDHFRFAVSVGKKVGNAVTRNKLKRQVREIIRNANIDANFDLFIIVNHRVTFLNYKQMETRLLELLEKHKLIEVNL